MLGAPSVVRALALLACLLLAPPLLAGQRAYDIGPAPGWVRPRAPVLSAPRQATEDIEMLLVDRQEAVLPSGIERYWHSAYRVLDEGAVQEHSQIEIVFDSSYQRLVLHAAVVKRDGRVINQLLPGRIRVAQRETRLEYQIYDGSLTVVLLLEDVRKGDVVEYSFTRRGSNPVFAGHYMAMFRAQETVPVHRQHFRLLWPRDRPLSIRERDTPIKPATRDTGSLREYEWAQANLPPLVMESNLPGWYDPFPTVQLSDFASWAQVAAWGDSLFPDAVPLPPQLVEPVAQIRARAETQEQRVLEALRFVQDEVRYLGIEIGVNSHRPYSPATVIRRRYGDCKDKTLVLLTMLRELGVQAWPALVSTDYGAHIRDYHPTATVFDHAIVLVRLDGRPYWVDPSALYQRGDLAGVAASYGAALVLGQRGDPLIEMAALRPPEPLTDVAVSFQLAGVGEPVAMTVETFYRGSAANQFRSNVSATSPKELQQEYANFYAESYPSIHSETVPKIEDNESENVVRTLERYTIAEFWREARKEGHIGTLTPVELARVVPSATGSKRTMPLAVNHPTHIRYRIDAKFEPGWSISRDDERIETPAARFSYRAHADGKVLTVAYEYETLADHVGAGAAAGHMEDMTRARDVLWYNITPPSTPATLSDWANPHQVNWSVLFIGLLALAVAIMAALRLQRAQPVGWPADAQAPAAGPYSPFDRDHLTGLGGWLVLVGFGVVIGPVRLLIDLMSTLPQYTASSWAALTTPGTATYHWLWAPVLLFELVCNMGLIVFGVLLIWLYFKKKRQFPAVFIGVTAVRLIVIWVDTGLASLVPGTEEAVQSGLRENLSALLAGLIWIAYMRQSRRVRNTFVN